MNYTYVLSSGFGFDNDYWNNYLPYIDDNIIFLNDLEKRSLDKNQKYIGIGHSLGFLKLNNSGINFDCLVGLQGFLNFCGHSKNIRTIREKGLKNVVNEFQADHNLALTNFHKACGCELSKNTTKQRLLGDLDLMQFSYNHCGAKTLIIGTIEDKIVPISLINDNFTHVPNVSVLQLKGCGHSLGFHMAEIVFRIINEFIIQK